jgi:predicted DNA-binding protein
MSIISIRLNKSEENILNYLTDSFEKEKSSLIKYLLIEKYEDLQDLKTINKFEKDEKEHKTSFMPVEDILTD